MSLNFFRICCKITAVGNIIAAILAMVSMQNHLEMNYGTVETNSIFRMFFYGFWVFVLTMGIAYWELSKNLFELRVIALIGAIGKLTLVGFWLHLFFTNQAKPMIWSGIIYDGFFGTVLAILYLKTLKKEA
ncbi:MAG: hypothetical protein K1X72_12600 [Pyrinomonadaceae bacterium]|nr:hypothetical protein [Pyrinomonadaceae bacterium]